MIATSAALLAVALAFGAPAAAAALVAPPAAAAAGVVPATVTPSDPEGDWDELPPGDQVVPPLESGTLTSRMWDTTWDDLVFVGIKPDGTFHAAYAYQEGAIVGRIQGNVLVGWWCESGSREPPSDAGEVQFRMVRTGVDVSSERLQGRWSYGVKEPDAPWRTWDGTYLDETPDTAMVQRAVDAEILCASAFAPLPTAPLTIDTPSTLSDLPTVQSVTPVAVAAAGGGAVVLIAVASYPAILLDGTLTAHRDRLFGWARAPAARVRRWGAASTARVPRSIGVTLGLVATLLLSGFIEPRFGFNLGSARLLLSLAISLFVERLLFLLIIRRLLRRRVPELAPSLNFAASSLIFVAIAVLLTRITGFEPGIVFGLVLGLAVATDLSRIGEARLALAASGWALVLGLVGWLGYSLLVALFGTDPAAFVLFLQETLSGFAVAGIAALPIALLPLAVLDGGAVWAWRKLVWLIAYAVGLAAFLIVVLPMPTSWDAVGSSWIAWIVLYGAFCLLSIGLWALMRFLPRKQRPAAPDLPATS
ncbi:MAG: hypothetical protein ABWY55_06960 [Microbacterium sp.]